MITHQLFTLNKTAFTEYENIKPMQCFCNGNAFIAEKIAIESVKDNLKNYVLFKYTLSDANGNFAGEGHYALDENTYGLWDASADGAYQLVCAGIGLELLSKDDE